MNKASPRTWVGVGALALAAGCATPEKPVAHHVPPGSVAVSAAGHAPERYVETIPEAATRALDRPGTWAAEGAKWGFIGPAGAALKNPIVLPAVLFTPLTTVAGAVIGGVSGAVYSVFTTRRLTDEQAGPLRDMVAVSVDERLNAAIASRVAAIAAELPGYRVVTAPTTGPVLEVTVTRAGLLAADEQSPPTAALNLYVTVHVVPLDESRAPGTRDHFYISAYRPLAEWQDEDGRVIAAELDAACAELAATIARTVFVAPNPQEAS
jgi:hypothetical protein